MMLSYQPARGFPERCNITAFLRSINELAVMSKKNSNSGVHTVTVDNNRGGQRLDNFLLNQLKGVPKSAIYRMIRTGQVRINGKRCKPAARLEEGDLVRIPPAQVRSPGEFEFSEKVSKQVENAVLSNTVVRRS